MGVNLRDLVPKTQINLKDLSGKSIAIDAYNALYQFLAIIRQPDGTPLKDRAGRVTSHLSGLFYRTCNLLEMGIKVIYVFDGTPPALKEAEIKRRSRVKDEALKKYEEALRMGRIEEARMYAQMTSRLKDYMAEDAKRLLDFMGIPWVQAPSEGEAQAAYLVKEGDADYCASQDYDSLLFGAPRLLRNLTISGRRKLPRKRVYVEVVPEVIELERVLRSLGITREQLIDIGILIGTDFNPDGVKGIGPKKALKLIKEYGSLEEAMPKLKDLTFPVNPGKIKEIFLNPEVTENYSIVWKEVDVEGVVDFLCGEKDFSEDRVRKALAKAISGFKKAKARRTIDEWF
ncbi:MAG: endonuclease [Candidatus Bathyarchaeota archaeon B26-1]|nr:MAG: endonuclease [Candidatus Bathyarchaeota archaeon B26-1]